jgi:hypothetical protein
VGSWEMRYSMGGGRCCVVPHGAREATRHECHQETSRLSVSVGSWERGSLLWCGAWCVASQ